MKPPILLDEALHQLPIGPHGEQAQALLRRIRRKYGFETLGTALILSLILAIFAFLLSLIVSNFWPLRSDNGLLLGLQIALLLFVLLFAWLLFTTGLVLHNGLQDLWQGGLGVFVMQIESKEEKDLRLWIQLQSKNSSQLGTDWRRLLHQPWQLPMRFFQVEDKGKFVLVAFALNAKRLLFIEKLEKESEETEL